MMTEEKRKVVVKELLFSSDDKNDLCTSKTDSR